MTAAACARRAHGASTVLVAVLAFAPAAAQAAGAQEQSATAGGAKGAVEVSDAIQTKLAALADEAVKKDAGNALLLKMAAVPKSAAAAKQIAAPSAASGSGTLVDAPGFPELVGLAFDNNLVGFKDNAFTLNFSLFAFRTATRPSIVNRQEEYATPVNGFLRRLGGALTVGGKGERFDRNGDGTADEAVSADSLGDIVMFEAKYRVWGTRDRRDDGNLQRYLRGVLAANDDVVAGIARFSALHAKEIEAISEPLSRRDQGAGSGPNAKAIQAFLDDANRVAELTALATMQGVLTKVHKASLDAIDRRMVWTVIAGATRQHPEFGPNRVHLGLNGVVGTGRIDHTVNLAWSHADAVLLNPDRSTWRVGYEASTLVFQGTLSEEGAKLSFSASGEHARNVPMARHDTIARASLTLVLPVGASAKLPLSLNYANHEDLLTDQHQLAAHIALTFDLSSLNKKKAAAEE